MLVMVLQTEHWEIFKIAYSTIKYMKSSKDGIHFCRMYTYI